MPAAPTTRMMERVKRGSNMVVHGIIGVIKIRQFAFLGVVTDRGTEPACVLQEGVHVFAVRQVRLLAFAGSPHPDENAEVFKLVQGVEQLLSSQGFFFAYHADLTLSLQAQRKLALAGVKPSKMHERAYVWNL